MNCNNQNIWGLRNTPFQEHRWDGPQLTVLASSDFFLLIPFNYILAKCSFILHWDISLVPEIHMLASLKSIGFGKSSHVEPQYVSPASSHHMILLDPDSVPYESPLG